MRQLPPRYRLIMYEPGIIKKYVSTNTLVLESLAEDRGEKLGYILIREYNADYDYIQYRIQNKQSFNGTVFAYIERIPDE